MPWLVPIGGTVLPYDASGEPSAVLGFSRTTPHWIGVPVSFVDSYRTGGTQTIVPDSKPSTSRKFNGLLVCFLLFDNFSVSRITFTARRVRRNTEMHCQRAAAVSRDTAGCF
jgi:hypothetical protein